MMSFNEFTNAVVDSLSMLYDNVELVEVTKNNGRVLKGVRAMNKGDNIAPTVYLSEFFNDLDDTKTFEVVMSEIKRIFSAAKPDITSSTISDWNGMKDKVKAKLINYELNKAYLADKPYRRVLDLALCYRLDLGDGMSAVITNNMMSEYGVSESELNELANAHTDYTITDFCGMTVVTSQSMMFGSAFLAFADKLKEVSQQFGNKFFIIPSSIHEVIIMPYDEAHKDDFKTMIHDVNSTVLDPQDILSDTLYMYNGTDLEIAK